MLGPPGRTPCSKGAAPGDFPFLYYTKERLFSKRRPGSDGSNRTCARSINHLA